ncbi:MAG TPA: AAA family ATPase [Nitrososphaeraceae archaeon]|nr:AAA family ATPase [Nitrososphaeraceae archaeon]
MWSEIYRPARAQDMIGNEDERLTVMKWLSAWVSGSKPLLLIGPPGVGKTTLVHALARQLDYDLIEMNASDTRNRDQLELLITPILENTSVFGKKILLFLDEVDGISGREDTGGIESILRLMKKPSIPVIMAANNKDAKIKELAKLSKTIQFNAVTPRLLMLLLDSVIKDQGKKMSTSDKSAIVDKAHGDIRLLLNILQAKISGYDKTATSNAEIDIAEAINGFFGAENEDAARSFLLSADANYPDPRFGVSTEERRKDMLGALFSSTVSSRIDLLTIADMLDVLSKVDMIVGRTGRKRQWSLLRYVDYIIAKDLFEKGHNKPIKYNQYSMRWDVMGPVFARSRSLKPLLDELARATHTSTSTFGSFYMPYLIEIIINAKIIPNEIAEVYNMDEKAGVALAKEIERSRSRSGLHYR